MPLQLTYHAETSLPVELAGLTPSWAHDKSLADIGRREIFQGNQRRPLSALFAVAGDPSDLEIDLHGDLSGVHGIGAQMREGQLRVHGSAGRHLGSQMSGGVLKVYGDTQDWTGAEMRGGLIHVHGSTGPLAGAAYRGSALGMTGGTLLIEGDAGDEVGTALRRGLIAVRGRAGDALGLQMRAGSIVVCGDCGSRPGAEMRRGTLLLLGSSPPSLLPTFRFATTTNLQIVTLMLHALRRLGFSYDPALQAGSCDLYRGDLLALGRGEILVRAGN
jgi:formylmethanofuran dehydrogenase subunit C